MLLFSSEVYFRLCKPDSNEILVIQPEEQSHAIFVKPWMLGSLLSVQMTVQRSLLLSFQTQKFGYHEALHLRIEFL